MALCRVRGTRRATARHIAKVLSGCVVIGGEVSVYWSVVIGVCVCGECYWSVVIGIAIRFRCDCKAYRQGIGVIGGGMVIVIGVW